MVGFARLRETSGRTILPCDPPAFSSRHMLCDLVLVGRRTCPIAAPVAWQRGPIGLPRGRAPEEPPAAQPGATRCPARCYTYKDAVIDSCNLDFDGCRCDPGRAELAYAFKNSGVKARDPGSRPENEQNKANVLSNVEFYDCKSYASAELLDDIAIVFTAVNEKYVPIYSFFIDSTIFIDRVF
jgi:hypothetical protein